MYLRNAGGQIDSELQGTDGKLHARLADSYDPAEDVTKFAMLRWDTDTLAWVKFTGSAGSTTSDVNVVNFPASQPVTNANLDAPLSDISANTAKSDKQKILAAGDRIISITKNIDGTVASVAQASASVGKTLTLDFDYSSPPDITITESVT